MSTNVLDRRLKHRKLVKPAQNPAAPTAKPAVKAKPEVANANGKSADASLLEPSRWYEDATRLFSLLKEKRVMVGRQSRESSTMLGCQHAAGDDAQAFSERIVAKLAPALATGLQDSVLEVFRDLERYERSYDFIVTPTARGTENHAKFVRSCLHRGGLLTAARSA